MKIALVHLNLSTESGDPRMLLQTAQGLAKAGQQVVVYTAFFKQGLFKNLSSNLDIREISPDVPLDETPAPHGIMGKIKERLARERIYTEAARKILSKMEKDFDVLFMQNDQSYKIGKAYKKMRPSCVTVWVMNNAPFRHTRKDNVIVNILSWAMSIVERLRVEIYKNGIDIIIVHDAEQQLLGKRAGLHSNILSIPVDSPLFYKPVRKIKKGATILLGVGSLSPARNFEDILRAAGILNKKRIRTEVYLVCKDFWNDQEYKNKLLNIANEENLGERAVFYFNGVSDEDLRKLQSKADFFVFPNKIKIWGVAALEAMASGMVLIVSETTSVAEILANGTNAVFFKPSHPEEIASIVEKLNGAPDAYERIASAGQRFVKDNLSWDGYIAKVLVLIKEHQPAR